VYEYRVIRNLLAPEREREREKEINNRLGNFTVMSCVIGTPHIRMIKSKEVRRTGMWHVWGNKEIHKRYLLGYLNDCGHRKSRHSREYTIKQEVK
jgi:hypothetical protein